MNDEQKAKPSLSTLLDINPENLKGSKEEDTGRNSTLHHSNFTREVYPEYPAIRAYSDFSADLVTQRGAGKNSIRRRKSWGYDGNDVNSNDRIYSDYPNRASDPNLQVVNNRNAIDEVANTYIQKEDSCEASVTNCFIPDKSFGKRSRSFVNEEMESNAFGATGFVPIISEPMKSFEEEMDRNVLKPSLSDVIHSEKFLQNISSLPDKHAYHGADSFVPIIDEPMKSSEEEMDLNALKPSLSDVIHSEEFLQNISSLPDKHAYYGAADSCLNDGSGIYTAAIDDEDIRKAYAGKNRNNDSSLADNDDSSMLQSGCSQEEQIFSVLPSRNATDKLVLRDCDVLFGRGKRSYEHKGNERFRKVVDELKPLYAEQTDKVGKKKVSIRVMETVHAYGGKFLQIVSSNPFLYEEVETNKARKKCSQRLRE